MKIKKQHLQIIIILVVGLWVACITFAISANYTKKKYASVPTTIPFTNQTTFAPATTDPLTTESTTQAPSKAEDSTEKPEDATAEERELIVPQSKKDIISAYVTAVNLLKNTDSFNLALMESLEIGIDEMTGGAMVKNIVQNIIDRNSDKSPQNFKFANGIDPMGITPDKIIAPRNVAASLSADDVISATSKKMSNNAYKVTITLGKQMQTLSVPARGYSTIVNVVEPETLDLPSSVSISEMNVVYDNTVIEATIDKDGKIIAMKHTVEVPTAEVLGKVTLASVSLKIHGNFTSSYTVTY